MQSFELNELETAKTTSALYPIWLCFPWPA